MSSNVLDIATYKFAQPEDCVLDANVWLFLYGPSDLTDPRISIYSSAVDKILKAKCKIHLDVTLLSEYVNRHARLQFDLMREYTALKAETFKQFRDLGAFAPIAAEISVAAKQIVKLCARFESDFSICPIEGLLDEFAKGTRDFNDQIIGHACKNRKFTLITDDGDFRSEGIKVLTANRKLLRN
jgi:hypothetical protein